MTSRSARTTLAALALDRRDAETALALMTELSDMARWLGLERVEIAGAGDLAPRLMSVITVPVAKATEAFGGTVSVTAGWSKRPSWRRRPYDYPR